MPPGSSYSVLVWFAPGFRGWASGDEASIRRGVAAGARDVEFALKKADAGSMGFPMPAAPDGPRGDARGDAPDPAPAHGRRDGARPRAGDGRLNGAPQRTLKSLTAPSKVSGPESGTRSPPSAEAENKPAHAETRDRRDEEDPLGVGSPLDELVGGVRDEVVEEGRREADLTQDVSPCET